MHVYVYIVPPNLGFEHNCHLDLDLDHVLDLDHALDLDLVIKLDLVLVLNLDPNPNPKTKPTRAIGQRVTLTFM